MEPHLHAPRSYAPQRQAPRSDIETLDFSMIGRTLGRYEIAAQLGVGGMGEVYRAVDVRLGREVAVKVLPPTVSCDAERLQRFEREARTLAALDHPNIVTLHALEEADGLTFLVLELVRGETLTERLRRAADEASGPAGLPLPEFFALAISMADALAAAHAAGITHRDLKPDNVMIDDQGRVKVLDFGLARSDRCGTAGLDGSGLTQEGMVLGTVPYCSPEQLQSLRADERSDVFSLGIVLHELLTGARPFQGRNPADLMKEILFEPAPDLRHLRADLPPGLARIVDRCLEKAPEARFQAAAELRTALERLQERLGLVPTSPWRFVSTLGWARQDDRRMGRGRTVPEIDESAQTLLDPDSDWARSARMLAQRRSTGRGSARRVAFGAFLALVTAVGVWASVRHAGQDQAAPATVAVTTVAVTTVAVTTVAVTEFVDLRGGDETGDLWLRHGLSELLAADLAQVPGLEVRAATTAASPNDPPDVIVGGHFVRLGDVLRVSVTFEDPASGLLFASRQRDAHDDEDLAILLDVMAAEIVDTLRAPEVAVAEL